MAQASRIKELEKEVASLCKKKNDKRTARKSVEANVTKLKDELVTVHHTKISANASFKKAAAEVMGHYCNCLRGIGCNTELPALLMLTPLLNSCVKRFWR